MNRTAAQRLRIAGFRDDVIPRRTITAYGRVIIALLLVMFPTLVEGSPVTIAWDRNTEPDIAGYLVYFGTQAGNYAGYVDVGAVTSAVMNTADSTTTYYFAVQAYSTSGVRSELSAEVGWAPTAQAPSLINPGSWSTIVGQTVALQLNATDPGGLALIYGAAGLPPGLSIAPVTGRISGIPTTPGAYNVTVNATNGAGLSASQVFSWSILTQPTPIPTPQPTPAIPTPPVSSDTAPPIIMLMTPTYNTTLPYATNADTIVLTGAAVDNVGVVRITWTNDRGGEGVATGTVNFSDWTTSPIVLKGGPNILTVTAVDAAGNTASLTLTVKTTGK